jgi:hypothetical protein
VPVPQIYDIATGNITYVINTATGNVWQLDGEYGSRAYTWTYAGKPTGRAKTTQGPDKIDS